MENQEENNQPSIKKVDLEPHNVKSWLMSVLTGFFLGLAVIFPGISGATISIIFQIYDKTVYAAANIFKEFKRCFLFALPLGIGTIIGFIAGFLFVQKLLDQYTFILICSFSGLMLGSSNEMLGEIKGTKITKTRIILLIIGFIFPIVLSAIFANVSSLNMSSAFDSFPIWLFILSPIVGFIVAITQIIPGLSATVLLMSIGFFTPIMDNLHIPEIFSMPNWIIFLVLMVIGFLVGYFLISKVINHFFTYKRVTMFYLITGLNFGSIVSIFYNSEILDVYKMWANGQGNLTLDLSVGIPLFVVCVALSFLLTLYKDKKVREKKLNEAKLSEEQNNEIKTNNNN